ncbi:hypothetical protein ACXR0O_21470 [Verrucomicrobiota bacterium sgz303538]
MLRRLFALAVPVLLGGCSTVPITQETIEGTYELRGKNWYAGESVALRNGSFTYSIFTDYIDDPRLKRFPVTGRYTLEGSWITLHHPDVPSPRMILIRRSGRFELWTPEQREQFLRTGRTPEDVLYQHR